jgi:DNA topoisomerase VI B subunit
MAGFGNPSQALFTTVREFVENSLDACDAAQVQPVVEVTLSRESSRVVTVTVADNGCGVPTDKVPDAFGRVLFGSKYSPRQRRGTFGLGATMAILYGQVTTDLPAAIHTRTKDDEGVFCRVFIDVENNSTARGLRPERRYPSNLLVTLHVQRIASWSTCAFLPLVLLMHYCAFLSKVRRVLCSVGPNQGRRHYQW